ncbi:MAG: lytic transglycosylase domain-containing protein [Neomegalonema sp.]|nr:lytic transglycosylase domain-containing protein [Neomegalonema sp.]
MSLLTVRQRLGSGARGALLALGIGAILSAALPLSVQAKRQPGALAPSEAPSPQRSRDARIVRMALSGVALPSSLSRSHPVLRDPIAQDLALWAQIRRAASSDWSALSGLLSRRGHWPAMGAVQAHAERAMPAGLGADEVLGFFKERAPNTGRGARLLGEALIGLGRAAEGELWIKQAWKTLRITRDETDLFLARHQRLLRDLHAERIDMLIERDQLSNALRLARALPADERAFVEARVALLRGQRGVDRKVARLKAQYQQDPRLDYARVVWRHRRGKVADAETLMRSATSDDLIQPQLWASRRALFARDALEEGRAADAYTLAAEHGLDFGTRFADLEWFAGWVALRHQDKAAVALDHFATLWAGVRTPISRGRAAYWAARSAEQLGDQEQAGIWWQRASEYAAVFYGQLAAERRFGAYRLPVAATVAPSHRRWQAIESEMIHAARLLASAGEAAEARLFFRALAARQQTEGDFAQVAQIARQIGGAGAQIKVAEEALDHGIVLWDSLYPLPVSVDFRHRRSEAALLLGIARQESRFAFEAGSGAGARGLMQLMPATARKVARDRGDAYDRAALTDDPEYNLVLADHYLADLVERFDGSYVLAVAAYNAGPSNVGKWIDRFGDPRAQDVDIVDWIESIPFRETRNYVQRVLEGVQVYRARLSDGATPLRLAGDLAR